MIASLSSQVSGNFITKIADRSSVLRKKLGLLIVFIEVQTKLEKKRLS